MGPKIWWKGSMAALTAIILGMWIRPVYGSSLQLDLIHSPRPSMLDWASVQGWFFDIIQHIGLAAGSALQLLLHGYLPITQGKNVYFSRCFQDVFQKQGMYYIQG